MSPVPAGTRRRLLARCTATGVAASVVVAVLSGCGTASDPGSGPPGGPGGHGADADRATRAALVLKRFAAAQQDGGSPRLSVAPGNLTRQEGDWEVAVGENDKLALLTGHLRAGTPPPSATSQGVLVDGSGREAATTVVSARDALAAMSQDRADCHGCTDLVVTAAHLTTMDVPTSSGTATVPAWRFALQGTRVTLLRAALPPSAVVETVSPGPPDPRPGDGPWVDSFSPRPDASTLRLHFTGAPDEAGPCGADYRAEQWASDLAVVVAVVQVPREQPAKDVACPAIGALRTVDVVLDAPLGRRAVLNLSSGSVVPRTSGQVDGTPVR